MALKEEVLLLASSSVDNGIRSWNLETGAPLLCYKSCASPSHGLTCLGQNLIVSSQVRESKASGSILYWTWDNSKVVVKSFPEELVNPLLTNGDGSFLFGGGVSGNLYLWEVATGRLLKKWRAHYRSVSCMIFNEDESLLITGSEDGAVKVWPFFAIFTDDSKEQTSFLHLHHFSEHMEGINSLATGCGGSNAIIISASKDRTCKVWSLSRGILLRTISFPSEVIAVALDPGEHVFYAGSVDGKIYIASLHSECLSIKNQTTYVLGCLSGHSKITCLEFASHENLLISGSFDGTIRAWDPVKRCVVRAFKHEKGPLSNVRIVRRAASRNHRLSNGELLAPPLAKYVNSTDPILSTFVRLKDVEPINVPYISHLVMENQIKEFQQTDLTSISCSKNSQDKWRNMFNQLLEHCVNEIVDDEKC